MSNLFPTPPAPAPTEQPSSPVLKALSQEFVRVRAKLVGAQARLEFAKSQVTLETALLIESERDLRTLVEAILDYGGTLPSDDVIPRE